MEHVVEEFPQSLFSEEIKSFLKTGPTWSSVKEMQNSKSAKEKGWNVKVHWDDEYIDNTCIGIGLFADEAISRGTVLRHGVFGKNVIPFNQDTNLPNLNNTATVEYFRNYGTACPCNSHMMVFLPGNSVNHSNDPNVILMPVKDGLDLIAVKDIENGEVLHDDYRKFGTAPNWFIDILVEQTGDKTCVFPGYNDYVF